MTKITAEKLVEIVKEEMEKVLSEGPSSGYKKLDAKELPAGYDTGEFGEPDDYANFGGSGFKKGKDWKYGPRGKETKIDQDIPSELDTDKKETGYEKMDEFNLNLGLAKGEYGDDVKGKVGYSIKIQNDDKLQSMSTSTFADLSKAKEFVKKNSKRIITTNIIPDLSKPDKVKNIDPKKLLRIKENIDMKKTELKQIVKEEFTNVMNELELQKEEEQLDAKKVLTGIKKFQKMFGTKAKLDIRKYPKSIGTIATVALPAGTEDGSPEQMKKHKDMQKAIKALKLPVSKLDSVKGQATFWVQYGVDESIDEAIKYKKGKKDMKGKDWVVFMTPGMDGMQAMFYIGVNGKGGWSPDIFNTSEFRLHENGELKAKLNFKEGNINAVAKKMHDLNDKAGSGEKNGYTVKDYADIIRVWVEMGKAMNESVTEGFSDGTDSFKDGVKDTAEQLGYTMVGEVEDANTTLNEKKSTDWEVTYDNNNIGGKKIKKGTKVKVKARNSEEAHKKAAKSLGLGDSYMALKGIAKRLGESVNEAQRENVGNLFIVKDDNGHIHLEIGGRSGQMNLGYVGGKKLKEFLSKLLKLSKK